MPFRSILNFLELDTKKVLIDIQDGWNNGRYREILFDNGIIQGQRFLDIFAIIVPIIPHVEFAIEGKAFFFTFFFL
jgi:hypothetical protein